MTDAAKPAWLGITVYLVTTGHPRVYSVRDSFGEALKDCIGVDDARIWECQMGQTPVDVTPKEAS